MVFVVRTVENITGYYSLTVLLVKATWDKWGKHVVTSNINYCKWSKTLGQILCVVSLRLYIRRQLKCSPPLFHRRLGDAAVIIKVISLSTFDGSSFLTRLVKLLLDECHKTPFMTILVLTQISVEIWCRQATMNWFICTSKCWWNLKYSYLFSDPCSYGKRFENCGAYHIEVYHVHIQNSFEHQNCSLCELRVRIAVKTLLKWRRELSYHIFGMPEMVGQHLQLKSTQGYQKVSIK